MQRAQVDYDSRLQISERSAEQQQRNNNTFPGEHHKVLIIAKSAVGQTSVCAPTSVGAPAAGRSPALSCDLLHFVRQAILVAAGYPSEAPLGERSSPWRHLQ